MTPDRRASFRDGDSGPERFLARVDRHRGLLAMLVGIFSAGIGASIAVAAMLGFGPVPVPGERLAAVERKVAQLDTITVPALRAEMRDMNSTLRLIADVQCAQLFGDPRTNTELVYLRRQCDALRVPAKSTP